MEKIKFLAKHILIAFLAVVVLLFVILQVIKFATHHGESIAVPQLVGLNPAEAEQMLAETGIVCEVVDSVHEKNIAPGQIVEQTPVAGTSVKSGRVIYITINAKKKKTIMVKDMRNRPLREVESLLVAEDLIIEEVVRVPSEYNDLVLDVKYQGRPLEPNAQIPQGSRLVLEVGSSSESGEEVVVPQLIGLTPAMAEQRILENQLVVGRIDFDETPNGNENAYFVYQQSKRAGSMTGAGSRIDIKLSKNPRKQPVNEPSNDEEFF